MYKKLIPIIFCLLLSGCGIQKAENNTAGILNIDQYIQLELSREKGTPKTIRIPKGTYHFYESLGRKKELYISNHDQTNPKNVGIYLENVHNVTIDGQGSKFIFHGRMLPLVLEHSSNVTLRNFSIDFELPQIRQLEILKVDTANDESIAKITPSGNYQIENGKITFTDSTYSLLPTWSMPFRKDGRLTYDRADVSFSPSKVKEVNTDTILIQNWEQNKKTSVGERFALRTYNRPNPGIFLNQNKNIMLEQITVHYAEGMGVLAQTCENVHLDGFSVKLKDNDERYFTTQADATHFSGCKGVIISENGMYEGMADDAINVHGTYLLVQQKIDKRTVIAEYMHEQAWGFLWGEKGDSVQIISAGQMELVSDYPLAIATIESMDRPTAFGAKTFKITFDQDLPDTMTSGKFGLENLTWSPEVIFKNNIVRNNRARGSLFSTPRRVICENNLFDHTHGTAILLCGDCNGWYETGACKDVIIRNNRFINALSAYYQFTNAIISVYPEIPELKKQKKFFHSNIVIENNIFETFDRPILYAKSTENLIFSNNTIKNNNEFSPFHWNKHTFFFEKVNKVKIYNNLFQYDFDPTKDLRVELSADNAVKIEDN